MPDIEKIEKALIKHSIHDDIIEKIMEGKDKISPKSKKLDKALHLAEVIGRIDNYLEVDSGKEILEWCACCKTGQRDKDCKNYGKVNKEKSLSDKVNGLIDVRYMGMARPRLTEDGTIMAGIYWNEDGMYKCPCSCINILHPKESVSITYCYCCAGHFRYHFQNALKTQLKVKDVTSSALNSKGKMPCEFIFEVIS